MSRFSDNSILMAVKANLLKLDIEEQRGILLTPLRCREFIRDVKLCFPYGDRLIGPFWIEAVNQVDNALANALEYGIQRHKEGCAALESAVFPCTCKRLRKVVRDYSRPHIDDMLRKAQGE